MEPGVPARVGVVAEAGCVQAGGGPATLLLEATCTHGFTNVPVTGRGRGRVPALAAGIRC